MSAPFALALVGCGKAKRPTAAPARFLYRSGLFRMSLAHAEAHAATTRIVSALHGLVDPDETLHPYALSLEGLPAEQQARWAAAVVEQLGAGEGRRVLLLAAGVYAEHLRPQLEGAGWTVDEPMAGLSLFRRMRWLGARFVRRAARWYCETPDCGQVLEQRASGKGRQHAVCPDCRRERKRTRDQIRRAA